MLTAIRKVEIGEKIRVKGYHRLLKETDSSTLEQMSHNVPRGFNSEMKELCGSIVTVEGLRNALTNEGGQSFRISEDHGEWYWNSYMFTVIEDDAWDWSE